MSDPTTVGRYRIISRLGQGGLGMLFLAHDPAIDRMVAIKLMRDPADTPELRERFAREARAAGRLRHPNIVTIFDVGEQNGQPFIAMEYVAGETLTAMIRRRAPLTLSHKLQLIEALCDALNYAHKSGMVHRDVKPANLMVDGDGVLKILDFGIVRLTSSDMTEAGMLVGTLGYMSPEQITGKAIDHRSDIFSVGGVAYELISYKQAFPGTLASGILNRVLNSPPEPLDHLCPDLDKGIVAIIDKALQKDPAERYQDLATMRRDLGRARERLEGDQLASRSVTVTTSSMAAARTREASTHGTPGRDAREQRRLARIQQRLADAERAHNAGQFEAALAAADDALLLDPENLGALDLLEAARAALDEREIRGWLDEARLLLDRQDLASAAELVDRARALRPAMPEIGAVQRMIDDSRRDDERRRERQHLVAEATARARAHLAAGALVSAMRAADEALAREPDAAEALEVKQQASALLAEDREQKHEQAAAEVVHRAHDAIAQGNHEIAITVLEQFKPPHPAVTKLLEAARRDREERLRSRKGEDRGRLDRDSAGPADRTGHVEYAVALAQRLFEEGALEACLRTIDEGLAVEPTNERLRDLGVRVKNALGRSAYDTHRPPAEATMLAPGPAPAPQPALPPHSAPVDEGTAFFRPRGAAEGDLLPEVQLIVSGSSNALLIGRAFKIPSRRFTIGRTVGDLTLPEPSWTREHAVIEYGGAGFAIRDLGSTNGTFVNGRQISAAEPLFFGTTIQIGQVVFTFTNAKDTSLPDLTNCVVANRYVLKKLLRESAKGAVYLAQHKHFRGEVVIKLLSPELLRYPGYREQFQHEAEMAAELRHPHICRVMDYGPVEVQPAGAAAIATEFLCLEFMAGGTLARRLESKSPLAGEQVAHWVNVLAGALQYSHSRDVIHGNLKPTSVVFDADENVYLTDFAIAQRMASGEGKSIVGTAAYMAPEQWETGTVTPAIDQFALAALAYYMTTGSRPFEGQDYPEVRKRNFWQGPMPAHVVAAGNGRELTPAVSRVLLKALSTSPSDRYPSIADFGKAFLASLTGSRASNGVQVFLSYQREAASGWAQFFASELKEKHGVSVFVDVERRDAAGRFPARLAQAIQDCDVFVVLLGASTLESKWVREEIKLAYEHGRPMVPVFQESWVAPDMPHGSDPAVETLMSYDGVHLLDRRNIHVGHTIADLARLVKGG